jgi:hypothetical protein
MVAGSCRGIEGQLFVEAGGVTIEAGAGDTVRVPPGAIGKYCRIHGLRTFPANMSNAKPQAPKVFVVPELMASGPVETGGLLEEHLKAQRLKEAASVRERIEAYLKDSGVLRKPAGEAWPNAGQLAGMSAVERQRWSTLEAQQWVDSSLKKLLGGKAPREVFKLDGAKRPRSTSAARDRNMCAEVLRLIERCDYARAAAVERVAEEFGVSTRVVERATELWSWEARGKKERRRFVPVWEQKLRSAGKLK